MVAVALGLNPNAREFVPAAAAAAATTASEPVKPLTSGKRSWADVVKSKTSKSCTTTSPEVKPVANIVAKSELAAPVETNASPLLDVPPGLEFPPGLESVGDALDVTRPPPGLELPSVEQLAEERLAMHTALLAEQQALLLSIQQLAQSGIMPPGVWGMHCCPTWNSWVVSTTPEDDKVDVVSEMSTDNGDDDSESSTESEESLKVCVSRRPSLMSESTSDAV